MNTKAPHRNRQDYSTRPVVFLGPSAPAAAIKALLPRAILAPPIVRDQLYRARERGARVILIIDGSFAHELAVSPREVVDVLHDGACIFGASSMGALRAADCGPAGIRGLGIIARLYRRGALTTDDEVAVATNPDQGYAALSVALINVRAAAARAAKRNLIDRPTAGRIVDAARTLFFPDRQWPAVLSQAGIADPDGRILAFVSQADLKREDALRAARMVAAILRNDPGLWERHGRAGSTPFVPPERYPGHDPMLGRTPKNLLKELPVWLFGSGRYQKYIWPLMVGEPEFHRMGRVPEDRAEAQRTRLVKALARICGNIDTFSQILMEELKFLEEMDAELMRWYAVNTLSHEARRLGLEPDPDLLARVQEEVAIAHGVRDWRMLQDEVTDGRLFGAIPIDWIEAACGRIAEARAYRGHLGTGL